MGIGRNAKETCNVIKAGGIRPASYSSAQSGGWTLVDARAPLVYFLNWGDIASTGTLDAKVEQATDSSGTGAKDITGKAITQQADTDDNNEAMISVERTELDTANNFVYARITVTPATAATIIGVTCARYWNAVPNMADLSSDVEAL
jgi:hypothetical protein